MRRLVTLTLVAGLVALATAALVDWLRDPDDPRRPIAAPTTTDREPDVDVEVSSTPPVWVEDRTGLADRFERNGIRGSLYLSADGCARGLTRPLRVVRLPRFQLTDGPRVAGCAFTVSADGGSAAGRHAAWSPSVPVFATQAPQGRFEVVDARTSAGLTLPGSAPAFRPDGSLTHALGGIVAWSNDCADAYAFISPPISFGPEEVGPYCSRPAVSRRELRRALPEGDRLTSVDGLAWLDPSQLLAILRSGEGWWIAAYEDRRSLGYANGLVGRSTTPPLADPTGRYVALTPNGYLEVYDRDALRVWASSSVPATAFAWSPDGYWLAYAADDRNVYFLRTSDWTTRFSLQADTDGLAWR